MSDLLRTSTRSSLLRTSTMSSLLRTSTMSGLLRTPTTSGLLRTPTAGSLLRISTTSAELLRSRIPDDLLQWDRTHQPDRYSKLPRQPTFDRASTISSLLSAFYKDQTLSEHPWQTDIGRTSTMDKLQQLDFYNGQSPPMSAEPP